MQLSNLAIVLQTWGPNSGKYTGSVIFKNSSGAIEITLDSQISIAVLQLCADALVLNAQKTASLLASNVLDDVQDNELKMLETKQA